MKLLLEQQDLAGIGHKYRNDLKTISYGEIPSEQRLVIRFWVNTVKSSEILLENYACVWNTAG